MIEMLLQPVHINRVFFKVLSSRSFSKGKRLWVLKSNMAFLLSCHCSKICQKDSPHQNVFKLTLSQKSLYVFRKDRECKFIFLLSPSLDLINIISIYTGSRSNESSQQNLAEKPVYFTSCWLLPTTVH